MTISVLALTDRAWAMPLFWLIGPPSPSDLSEPRVCSEPEPGVAIFKVKKQPRPYVPGLLFYLLSAERGYKTEMTDIPTIDVKKIFKFLGACITEPVTLEPEIDQWLDESFQWAVEREMLLPDDDGKYYVGRYLSRTDLALMLYRYLPASWDWRIAGGDTAFAWTAVIGCITSALKARYFCPAARCPQNRHPL